MLSNIVGHLAPNDITPETVMWALLIVFIIGSIVSLWNIHTNPKYPFKLTDLFVEDNKLSERKVARFGAFVISSWTFIYLSLTQQLTEWYFLGYMGAWVANAIISKHVDNKNQQP